MLFPIINEQILPVFDVQDLVDVADVVLHGIFRYKEAIGDVAVRPSARPVSTCCWRADSSSEADWGIRMGSATGSGMASVGGACCCRAR